MSKYSEASESYRAGYAHGYAGEVPDERYITDADYDSGYLAGDEDYEDDEPDLSGTHVCPSSCDYVEPDAYRDWDYPEWRPRGDAPMGAG